MRSCYSLIEVMCSLSVVIRVCCIQTYFVYDLEICLLNLGIAMDSSVKPMNLVDLSSSYFPYSREKKNKIKTKNILFQSYTEGFSLIMISVHLCCLPDNVKQIISSPRQSRAHKTTSQSISEEQHHSEKPGNLIFFHFLLSFIFSPSLLIPSHSNFPHKITERKEKVSFLDIVVSSDYLL